MTAKPAPYSDKSPSADLDLHNEFSRLRLDLADVVAQLNTCRVDIDHLAAHKAARKELDLIVTSLQTATEAMNALRLVQADTLTVVQEVLAILTAAQDEDVRPKMERLIATLDKVQAFKHAAATARRLLA